MDSLERRTPAHGRFIDELLVWDGPRPLADPGLVEELRDSLLSGLDEVAASLPDGERLFLGKTSLAALACDGRYLDLVDSPFAWSGQMVAGKLIHRTLELDHATTRSEAPDALVRHAWDEMATAQDGLADFVNGMKPIEGSLMRQQVAQRVTEYRDLWPHLPAGVPLRMEERMQVRVDNGVSSVVVQGTPDVVFGNVRDDRCRLMLVDLKTGHRNPMTERQDLRLYALLATIKYGQTPFRWATYYVAEGAWDAEDLDPDLLRGAVQRVLDGARKAARLRRDTAAELRLVPGAWCRFCGRRPDCEVAATDDPEW